MDCSSQNHSAQTIVARASGNRSPKYLQTTFALPLQQSFLNYSSLFHFKYLLKLIIHSHAQSYAGKSCQLLCDAVNLSIFVSVGEIVEFHFLYPSKAKTSLRCFCSLLSFKKKLYELVHRLKTQRLFAKSIAPLNSRDRRILSRMEERSLKQLLGIS